MTNISQNLTAREAALAFQTLVSGTDEKIAETVHAYSTKAGAWFTSNLTGNKARGFNAIVHLLATELDQLRPELEANEADEPGPAEFGKVYVETFEEACAMEPGRRYWVHPRVTLYSSAGKPFKHNQPLETIRCRHCGAARPVHVQDMPQVNGRCHACILDARGARRNARRRAKRGTAKVS